MAQLQIQEGIDIIWLSSIFSSLTW